MQEKIQGGGLNGSSRERKSNSISYQSQYKRRLRPGIEVRALSFSLGPGVLPRNFFNFRRDPKWICLWILWCFMIMVFNNAAVHFSWKSLVRLYLRYSLVCSTKATLVQSWSVWWMLTAVERTYRCCHPMTFSVEMTFKLSNYILFTPAMRAKRLRPASLNWSLVRSMLFCRNSLRWDVTSLRLPFGDAARNYDNGLCNISLV